MMLVLVNEAVLYVVSRERGEGKSEGGDENYILPQRKI